MIVYFTGTGNSRYVADMLADMTGDTAVDAAKLIKDGKKAELESERPWVFVSPVYVSAPPVLFMDWVKAGLFTGSKKAYFVQTCAGGMGACPVYWQEVCGEVGFEYMGTEQVVMPQNYLAFFKTKEKDDCDRIVADALPSVRAYACKIAAGEIFDRPAPKGWETSSTKMILKPYYKWFISAKKFYATDACISCGRCVSSCMLNNITLVDGKPRWGDKCTHCMACISYCPKQAVEYGKASQGKPRYHCVKYTGDK